MGALLKCQDCGYVISSAENIELAKNIAERTNQCQKCHSKRFVVSKQPEKTSLSNRNKTIRTETVNKPLWTITNILLHLSTHPDDDPTSDSFPGIYVFNQTRGTAARSTSTEEGVLVSLFPTI